MNRKYKTWFYFCQTEEEARAACARENASGSLYKRKHHAAHYTPWTSMDGKEHKYIIWTVR